MYCLDHLERVQSCMKLKDLVLKSLFVWSSGDLDSHTLFYLIDNFLDFIDNMGVCLDMMFISIFCDACIHLVYLDWTPFFIRHLLICMFYFPIERKKKSDNDFFSLRQTYHL